MMSIYVGDIEINISCSTVTYVAVNVTCPGHSVHALLNAPLFVRVNAQATLISRAWTRFANRAFGRDGVVTSVDRAIVGREAVVINGSYTHGLKH